MAIPLLSLLLMGLSTGANYIGNQRSQNAIAGTINSERARQKKLDEEAFAVNDRSRDQYQGAEGNIADRSGELADMYMDATETAPTTPIGALPQSDSNLVVSGDIAQGEKTRLGTMDDARRRADFQSFGSYFGDMNRTQARGAGEIGMLGGFKRGSSSVLPSELDVAAMKGKNWMMLGDLLNAGAGIAGAGKKGFDPSRLTGGGR